MHTMRSSGGTGSGASRSWFRLRRLLVVAAALAVTSVLLVGCGEERGSKGPYSDTRSAAQLKEQYQQAMLGVMEAMDAPKAAPIEMSIRQGNRSQLVSMAQRWDAATARAKSIDAPAAIRSTHDELVTAMEGLGNWNRRIAAAAPNKARTRKLGKQALNSPERAAFARALDTLAAKGYLVQQEQDPFAEAQADAG